MPFSENPDNTGTLAFARQLEAFRDRLQWAACSEISGMHLPGNGCRCNGSPDLGHIAAAFLVLLNALEKGAAPVPAVQAAMSEYQTMKLSHERSQDPRQH